MATLEIKRGEPMPELVAEAAAAIGSQKKLAEALCVSHQAVSFWKTKGAPSPANQRRMREIIEDCKNG